MKGFDGKLCLDCKIRIVNIRYRYSINGGTQVIINIGQICPKCKRYRIDDSKLGIMI